MFGIFVKLCKSLGVSLVMLDSQKELLKPEEKRGILGGRTDSFILSVGTHRVRQDYLRLYCIAVFLF